MTLKARMVATGVIAVFAVACERSAPTGPMMSAEDASFAKSAGQSNVTCTVEVGSTQHQLNAVHELGNLLNMAISNKNSSVNCGGVRSLEAKLQAVAKALDVQPPNYAAACGVSGALVNELNALVQRGQLATPSFPPPFPGGPTNVLSAAMDLNQHWCDAARGILTGPRS